MAKEAFTTSEGIYNTCYNVAGLAFQTPEALMRDGHFRSVRNNCIKRNNDTMWMFFILVWLYASVEYMGNSKSH